MDYTWNGLAEQSQMVIGDNKQKIIPKEVLDSFARYIIPEIRRFHESEEGPAFYKEWIEKHPEYAEK